jgi:hypothetical protein
LAVDVRRTLGDAGALLFGAVVAVTLSTSGQISFGGLWAGLGASAVTAVPRAALAIAAFLGFGLTVVLRFAPEIVRRLSRLELALLAWIMGLLIASQLFWLLGVLDLYRPAVLLSLQALGALALVGHLLRPPSVRTEDVPSTPGERLASAVLLALIGAVAGAYLAQSLGTRVIRWDALQYHLGLPRWYLRLGGFEHFPSHPKSGIYLGTDMLYGTVLTIAEPLQVIAAKLLSWAFGLTAIVGVFLLARRLGAPRTWALVATLGMLTVPAIANWGLVKNDLTAAGVAIAALWLLAVAFREREAGPSLWIGLCLGYAVTVKITMLPVVPVVGVAVMWRFGWGAGLRCALGSALPLVPWAARAWWLHGAPLFPLFRQQPEYVRELWRAWSPNGLTLSVESFVRNLVPLLLNSTGRVHNNYSLGVPALVAMLLAIPATFRRGAARVACLAAGTLLLVLLVRTFETRPLNRYFLVVPAVAFAVACAWLSSRSSHRLWRTAVPLVAGMALLVAYLNVNSVFQALAQPSVAASIKAGGAPLDDRLTSQLRLVRQAEGLLEPGEILLINDAAIYLLDEPWVNGNAFHSTVFRYDQLEAPGLARQLRSMGVGAALISKLTPGYQPQLKEVIRRHGTAVAGPRWRKAFDLSWDALPEEQR